MRYNINFFITTFVLAQLISTPNAINPTPTTATTSTTTCSLTCNPTNLLIPSSITQPEYTVITLNDCLTVTYECPIGDEIIVYLKNGSVVTETCTVVVYCDACGTTFRTIAGGFPSVPTGTAVNLIDCIQTGNSHTHTHTHTPTDTPNITPTSTPCGNLIVGNPQVDGIGMGGSYSVSYHAGTATLHCYDNGTDTHPGYYPAIVGSPPIDSPTVLSAATINSYTSNTFSCDIVRGQYYDLINKIWNPTLYCALFPYSSPYTPCGSGCTSLPFIQDHGTFGPAVISGIVSLKKIQMNVGPCPTLLLTVSCSSNLTGYDPYLTIGNGIGTNQNEYITGFDTTIPAVFTMYCDGVRGVWVTFQDEFNVLNIWQLPGANTYISCELRSTAGCPGCGALRIGDASAKYYLKNTPSLLSYSTVGGICSATLTSLTSDPGLMVIYTDVNSDSISNIGLFQWTVSTDCIAGSYNNISASNLLVYYALMSSGFISPLCGIGCVPFTLSDCASIGLINGLGNTIVTTFNGCKYESITCAASNSTLYPTIYSQTSNNLVAYGAPYHPAVYQTSCNSSSSQFTTQLNVGGPFFCCQQSYV